MATGAPSICGLISAIIAGFVIPSLGGAYITISGSAEVQHTGWLMDSD